MNVNIAATTVENYEDPPPRCQNRHLHSFQETYNPQSYGVLHPAGPKHDYAWHTEAMDRAMQGRHRRCGPGGAFGLDSYRQEFTSLLMHAEHLEIGHGRGAAHNKACPG